MEVGGGKQARRIDMVGQAPPDGNSAKDAWQAAYAAGILLRLPDSGCWLLAAEKVVGMLVDEGEGIRKNWRWWHWWYQQFATASIYSLYTQQGNSCAVS